MRIISMSATFGKLEGDVLHLEPGLNVISAPNEWGKSTWCAFITAMLYGVETRERTSKGQLADKEKYSPWSGRPMEGILRLEHQGRDITIQRRTRGRIPLGDFQAYETRTGLPVQELTGENCGNVLLGVEKSVFLRTGFIRFSDLSVTPDEALWQRLQQSVTTGDESGGAAMLGKKLRELKNRCRSPRGGLIPELQGLISRTEGDLADRQRLEEMHHRLAAQTESAREELESLQRHSRVCAWRQAQSDREQTEAAVQAAKEARDAYEHLEEQCREIPLRRELTARLQRARDLMEELRDYPEEPPTSVMGTVLFGVLAGIALLCGGFFLFREQPLWAASGAVAALILAFTAGHLADLRRRKLLKQKAEQRKRESRVRDLTRTIALIQEQLAQREDLERARRTADETRIRLQAMVATARQAASEEQDDDLELSAEQTQERIGVVTERLRQLQLRLGQCQGKMELLSGEETLLRQLEDHRRRLKELEAYERSLELGLEALEEAKRELQRRFAPRLTALTGDYLIRLTGGRYHRVVIGQDLSIQTAGGAETALREARWRSDGTADQMSLALRLAVWITLNPDGPLILDDALIRMDDERLKQAMGLLKDLAADRQILLFSCQSREKQLV